MSAPRPPRRLTWLVLGAAGIAALLVAAPGIDLAVSGWFHEPGGSFLWRFEPAALSLHDAIQWGSRLLFAALLAGFLYSAVRLRRLFGLGSRQWLFLLAALLVGPGLVANVVLKDNWGRARPWQVEDFGGTQRFTPPLVITDQCTTNCSFVAGDPSIAFYLHGFAYVVPRRRRAVLAGGLAAGVLAGVLRIGMGAHFFSDVLFAAGFMLATTAALHALVFGARETLACWREWLGDGGPPWRP